MVLRTFQGVRGLSEGAQSELPEGVEVLFRESEVLMDLNGVLNILLGLHVREQCRV